MSQDSAMLTDVLAKSCDGIGVWPSYQVGIPGAMKARGLRGGTIRRKMGRDRPILWPHAVSSVYGRSQPLDSPGRSRASLQEAGNHGPAAAGINGTGMTEPPNRSMLSADGLTAPLRHSAFRRIWLASLLSNLGLLIQGVGAAWAMVQMTSSADQVALVQTALMLPVMLIS